MSCCAYRICWQVVHWAAPLAAGFNALCPTPSFSWLTSYLQIHFKCHLFGQAFLDILNSFSPQLLMFSNLAPSISHLWCYCQLWWHIYLFLCLLLSIFPTDEFHEIRAMSVLFIVLYWVPGTWHVLRKILLDGWIDSGMDGWVNGHTRTLEPCCLAQSSFFP